MATPATATATAADELDRQAAERAERLCAGVVPVVAPNGAPVYRVERGGECTYHGPGQLVVYPMLDLTRRRRPRGGSSGTGGPDLHDYLRRIEGVVIRTLAEYGVRGERDADHTGVWVGPSKVAAVGVSASRWITTHGFAINVRPDLAYFDTSVILPCGIDGRGVTSLAEIMGESAAPTVLEVSRVVMEELSGEFDLDVEATRCIPPAR
jgi:lipoate-protein ligase B